MALAIPVEGKSMTPATDERTTAPRDGVPQKTTPDSLATFR
jgi:hypothetical protein